MRHLDCESNPSTSQRKRTKNQIPVEAALISGNNKANGQIGMMGVTTNRKIRSANNGNWTHPNGHKRRSNHQIHARDRMFGWSQLQVLPGKWYAPTTNPDTAIGELGTNSPAFKQVLAGWFEPEPHMDNYMTKLLKYWSQPTRVQDIPKCTLHEYWDGWCKAWELMSSSLSGIHFGHYMVGMFNPDILIFNASMADIPMQTGYSPNWWKEGLNIMLEKIPRNQNVEKLRIILLFEADFNANNKWIGQAVMMKAESLNLLADKQYGSRCNKATILQCLNKGLFYDILWQWRKPATLCSNDAKSCYDQITLLAAAMSLCHLGAPTQAVQSMTKMIHRMQHHIQTAYGDSKQAASRKTWNKLIAGIGLGNIAGPSIWAAVSSPMFDIMQQNGFYALLTGAISWQQREILGFTFIDDTDLCVTHTSDSTQNIVQQMQKVVTNWEGLLQATGGALVPEKVLLVFSQFWTQKWPVAVQNDQPSTGRDKLTGHHTQNARSNGSNPPKQDAHLVCN